MQTELAYDRGSPNAEWAAVAEILRRFPDQREAMMLWLFEHSVGYVDTRARAGVEFLEINPAGGWSALERLVSSQDPDDLDTALEVLEILNTEEAARWALPLLDDAWPYIAQAAAAFVGRFYPPEEPHPPPDNRT